MLPRRRAPADPRPRGSCALCRYTSTPCLGTGRHRIESFHPAGPGRFWQIGPPGFHTLYFEYLPSGQILRLRRGALRFIPSVYVPNGRRGRPRIRSEEDRKAYHQRYYLAVTKLKRAATRAAQPYQGGAA